MILVGPKGMRGDSITRGAAREWLVSVTDAVETVQERVGRCGDVLHRALHEARRCGVTDKERLLDALRKSTHTIYDIVEALDEYYGDEMRDKREKADDDIGHAVSILRRMIHRMEGGAK